MPVFLPAIMGFDEKLRRVLSPPSPSANTQGFPVRRPGKATAYYGGLSEADIQRAGIVARNELAKRSGDQQKERPASNGTKKRPTSGAR
jgi:hypothetical protein